MSAISFDWVDNQLTKESRNCMSKLVEMHKHITDDIPKDFVKV